MIWDSENNSKYFIILSIITFVIIGLWLNNLNEAVIKLSEMLINIIPIFAIVFVLFALTDYFIDSKKIARHLGEKHSIKGWVGSAIAGILSTGPIYMWYPLLNDLQKKGVDNSYITIFLYNRAIKPALIPMMILYFGLVYTIVLTVVMFITSIINGIILSKILEVIESKKD